MLALWAPFCASCIDSFLDITSVTNRITQIIWFVSLFCGIKLFMQRSYPPILKSLLLFASLLTVYGGIHLLLGQNISTDTRIVPKTEYLIGVVNSIYPIFFVYYFSSLGYITEKHIYQWSFFFIAAVLISYPNSINKIQDFTDAEQFTNNIGYVILRCVPFLLFWYKKPIVQYLIFIVLGIIIMNTLKRGPILIWFILLGVLFSENYKRFKYMPLRQKIFFIASPLIVIAFGIYYFDNYLVSNEGFMDRLRYTLGGDDSGRVEIYSNILNLYFNESSFTQLLFGHGADATIKFFSIHAHNDWLELLLNQGLIGVVFYIFYYRSFWTQIHCSQDTFGRGLLVAVAIMSFVTSVFSMSYMAYDTSVHIVFGYAIFRSQISEKIGS